MSNKTMTRHQIITGLSKIADLYKKEGRGAFFNADNSENGTFSITTYGNDKNPPVWKSWRDREADMEAAGFKEVSEGIWKAV